MTVHIYNQAEANEESLKALLTLFQKCTISSDYMAQGEIDDMDTLTRVLSNKNLLHFFGYEDGVPVAYCQVLHKADSKHFNSGAKINALSVLPEKRGQGLGTALLEEVITTLKKNPTIKNIYLDVVKENAPAIALYKKVGFEKVGELRNLFTKDGVLMDIETYSLVVE